MKFSCDRDLLLDAINVSQKAISGKSTLPALEGILISAVNNGLKITGYDLEIGIESTVEANVSTKGSIVLNSRIFGDIIRKMPSDMVYITVDEKMVATITCARSEFSISALSAQDYPEIPKVDKEKSFLMPQKILKSMIRQTLFAVSQNDNKPVHTGALFEIINGVLNVVAVDGYRLALRKEFVNGAGDMSFVIPGKTLAEVGRILKDDEEAVVTLSLSKKHILFEIDNVTVVSRLLEGEFLNYENAIPKTGAINATVDVKAFSDCVERASLLISEKMKSPIRLNIKMDTLSIKCTTTLGKVQDEIDIENDGGEIEIGFNNRYLLDALKACEADKVVLELNTPLTPCVVKPTEGDSFTFLVLPVRLKANEN